MTRRLMAPVTYKPEIALGHLIQLVMGVFAVAAIYWALVRDIDEQRLYAEQTRALVDSNTEAIKELQSQSQAVVLQVQEAMTAQLEGFETRTMGRIGKIEDDVSWLVRREADKK